MLKSQSLREELRRHKEAKAARIQKRLLETSLIDFTAYFFAARGEQFIVADLHRQIQDALQKVERGEIRNLLINMPPRYGKTEMAVVNWMAQCIARNPKARFMHLSFSSELALENSTKTRELVKSEAFQKLWPIKIKGDADSKQKWYTEHGGGLYATMAGGAVTGFGAGSMTDDGQFAGAIIIDDPLKASVALSDVERQAVNDRLNSTIKSRRNSRGTPIIIIMQRLHADDMSGFVLAGGMGEEFVHLNLKALRDDGTALWPMKHTAEELLHMSQHDRYTFASQYQQEPVPLEGAVYKYDWFPRYDRLPAPEVRTQLIHSWDTSYKAGDHNDPTCCTVWHCTPALNYLAEVHWGRWEYPDIRRRVFELANEQKPDAILIEDKASGQSLIQELQQGSNYPIIAIKPEGDKLTRARVVAAMVEAQRVALPNTAPWLGAYEAEMMTFPASKHFDMVDSTSQFLRWIKDHGGDGDYVAMMKRMYPDM